MNKRRTNYLQDKYPGLNDHELWTLILCSRYASKELYSKYAINCNDRIIHATSLCVDGRRIPTVRRYLESVNLIKTSYSTDDNLEIIPEEIEKLIPSCSTKEPEFNTSGFFSKKEHYWQSEGTLTPITDLGEVYLDVSHLNAYEIIHLYRNQQLYDFREFKHTRYTKHHHYSNTSSSHSNYYLKVYPLSAVTPASDASVVAAGQAFAKDHAREVLSAAFNLKFRAINDSKAYTTEQAITERLADVEEKLRLLHRTRKELLVLRAKTTTLGDEALTQLVIDTGIKYIRRKAPLWMNSDDAEKKKLAMLVLKGVSVITDLSSTQ